MKAIYIVVGDIGACKELLPVATLLQRDGFEIVWVADEHGKAQDLLKKAQLEKSPTS